MKPIFRITLGPCSELGLEITVKNVENLIRIYDDIFDYYICFNGYEIPPLDIKNVTWFKQNWSDCPVEDDIRKPLRDDGNFEIDGKYCGGTIWKTCPPRLNINVHEIVMDNDIILLDKIPEIDAFLNGDKVLIMEDPVMFYGRYDILFGTNKKPFYNSGLMGFPPGYNFGDEIFKVWNNFRFKNLSQADEQGLLMYTLSSCKNKIVVTNERIKLALARDFGVQFSGEEKAIHFTQANRCNKHIGYSKWIKSK